MENNRKITEKCVGKRKNFPKLRHHDSSSHIFEIVGDAVKENNQELGRKCKQVLKHQ